MSFCRRGARGNAAESAELADAVASAHIACYAYNVVVAIAGSLRSKNPTTPHSSRRNNIARRSPQPGMPVRACLLGCACRPIFY